MLPIVLGIFFVIQAVLNYFGFEHFLAKKDRNKPYTKKFQRGLVFPQALFGICWIIIGIIVKDHDSTMFSVLLIVTAVIPIILMYKNRRNISK